MTHEQGSPEWLAERVGHITSSRMKDVMDRTQKGAPTAKCKAYVVELIHGLITNDYIEIGNFWQLAHGKEFEPEARAHYAFKTGLSPKLSGFVKANQQDLFDREIFLPIGGSPDFTIDDPILGKGGGEIKCPQKPNHTLWLGLDTVPEEHYEQCQSNMWLCGADWWDFISYNPTFPPDLQLLIRRTWPNKSFIDEMLTASKAIADEVLADLERRKTIPTILIERPTFV